METFQNLPLLFFRSDKAWQDWLADHHAQTPGVWLKFAKKHTGITSLTYDPALDVALCYGWIDGQARTLDADYYLQKFTLRRPKSVWSKRNVAIVTRLISEGKMQPAGFAAIEAAKQDGRWEQAYDSLAHSTVPADFQALLDQHPKAKSFFATLNKTNAYTFLRKLQTIKRPETRSKHMHEFIGLLEEGKILH